MSHRRIREKIRLCFECLTNELLVKPLIPYLFQENIITDDDSERIAAEITTKDKAKRFLSILKYRSDSENLKFVEKLDEPCYQPHLAKMILSTEVTDDVLETTDDGCFLPLKSLEEWSKDDVSMWLKSIGMEESIASLFHEEKISGDILATVTKEDIKSFCPGSKYGDRIKILRCRDAEQDKSRQEAANSEQESTNAQEVRCTKQVYTSEQFRNFDRLADSSSAYSQHSSFPSDSVVIDNLIEPVHNYLHPQGSEAAEIHQFSIHIVPFLCACLNDRTNGTFHFGVSKDGVILGLEADVEEFQQTLNTLVSTCFSDDQLEIVRHCVRPVRLVEVKPRSLQEGTVKLFVVEVDVVPSHSLCTDEAFFAKPLKRESTWKNIELDRGKVYRFDQGTPVPFSDRNLIEFMETKEVLAKLRQKRERSVMRQTFEKDASVEGDKLTRLLCHEGRSLDGNIYPIFVLSPLPFEKELNIHFLNSIEKKAVFDFDTAALQTSIFCDHESNAEAPSRILSLEDFKVEPGNCDSQGYSMMEDEDFSTVQPWIFCNGNKGADEPVMNVFEWKHSRRQSFIKAVDFFHERIPCEHAIVVFLVFSDNYEVMLCALEEFCLRFKDNWMVICENASISSRLKEYLFNLQHVVSSEKEFDNRSVVGMPWRDVHDTILKCVKSVSVGAIHLTTSAGKTLMMSKKALNDLEDLEVLSSDHLSNAPVVLSNDKAQLNSLQSDKELRFYQGEEVDWWNFFFRQVLQRDLLPKIVSNTEALLLSDQTEDPEERVGVMAIYHLPGSGGTTLGKHVLWELKEKYHCVVLKRLTKDTASQLSRLLAYDDQSNPQPILVLLDNFDETQIQTLKASLEFEAQNLGREIENPPSIPFVLLVCIRCSSNQQPNADDSCQHRFEIGHCLSGEEIRLFQRKYEDLEKEWQEKRRLDPRMLISFNILRENFSSDYIKRTVPRLVTLVTDFKERLVLKYIAFVGAYDPVCSYIPASCFDGLMSRKGCNRNPVWLNNISRSFKTLINYDPTKREGLQLAKMRIIHSLLSEEIYKELVSVEMKPSDVMIEFLFSDMFKNNDAATKELKKVAYSLTVRRARRQDGLYKDDFSPVIQSVIDDQTQDNTRAEEIMKRTYELTNYFVVAQHIARFYIFSKDWESAEKWAKLVTERFPKEEVLWNTYGNVYREQLIQKLQNKEMLVETLEDSLHLVSKTMDKYQEEQRVGILENDNPSGLISEGNTILLLIDSFKGITELQESDLRRFLVDSTFVPACLRLWRSDSIAYVKALQGRVLEILQQLERRMFSESRDRLLEAPNLGAKMKKYREQMIKITHAFRRYYGEDPKEAIPSGLSNEEIVFFLRRQIFSLEGHTLAKMMQHFRNGNLQKLQEISKLAERNLATQYYNMRDYQTAIGAKILSTIGTMQGGGWETSVDKETILQLRTMSHELLLMSENCPSIPTQAETYLFFALLHWPTSCSEMNSAAAAELKEALTTWRQTSQVRNADCGRAKIRDSRSFNVLFLLGSGNGLDRIVVSNAQTNRHSTTPEWLQGIVVDGGQHVSYTISNQRIDIPLAITQYRNRWKRQVYFKLGFTWSGPLALSVSVEDPRKLRKTTLQAINHHHHSINANRQQNYPGVHPGQQNLSCGQFPPGTMMVRQPPGYFQHPQAFPILRHNGQQGYLTPVFPTNYQQPPPWPRRK